MKRTYETPSAEKLEFNYTDVVTASGAASVIEPAESSQDPTYCLHGSSSYTFSDNHECSKDPDRTKNKKCY